MSDANLSLGPYLKKIRTQLGFTLREVEEKTAGRIKNSYLSQVENGLIEKPNPSALWELAELYGLSYDDVLVVAGYRRPRSENDDLATTLQGIPLRALTDLTPEERGELAQYLEFLHHRRKARR